MKASWDCSLFFQFRKRERTQGRMDVEVANNYNVSESFSISDPSNA